MSCERKCHIPAKVMVKKTCFDHSRSPETLTKTTTVHQNVVFPACFIQFKRWWGLHWSLLVLFRFFLFYNPNYKKVGSFCWTEMKTVWNHLQMNSVYYVYSVYSEVFPGSYSNFICTVTSFTVCWTSPHPCLWMSVKQGHIALITSQVNLLICEKFKSGVWVFSTTLPVFSCSSQLINTYLLWIWWGKTVHLSHMCCYQIEYFTKTMTKFSQSVLFLCFIVSNNLYRIRAIN